MFADSGASLPGYARTSTPAQVTDAVIRAIEHNRAEVDVAPLPMRAGVRAAALAPGLAVRVQRLLGGDAVSAAITDTQRGKR
jgi:uncharacterized protein